MQLLKLDSCVVAISYNDVEQFLTVCVCTFKREQWKECKMEKAHTRPIHVPSRGAPTTSAINGCSRARLISVTKGQWNLFRTPIAKLWHWGHSQATCGSCQSPENYRWSHTWSRRSVPLEPGKPEGDCSPVAAVNGTRSSAGIFESPL